MAIPVAVASTSSGYCNIGASFTAREAEPAKSAPKFADRAVPQTVDPIRPTVRVIAMLPPGGASRAAYSSIISRSLPADESLTFCSDFFVSS